MPDPATAAPPAPPETARTLDGPWWSVVLVLAGVYLAVLAARWYLIERSGTAIPFWDQWLFEAPLLKRVITGSVHWRELISAANEHRILWTRLLQITTFEANAGRWDSRVLMTVNALLAAGVPVLLLAVLRRALPRGQMLALLGLALLLWLSPVLWFNTLWSIQSIVYFLVLFSVGGMALLLGRPALSRAWWGGVALLLAALFSMGSGLLAAATVAGICLLRGWRGGLRGDLERRGNWITLGTAVAITLAGVALQLGAQRIGAMQARGVADFLGALVKNFAFPFSHSWLIGADFHAGLVLWLPGAIYLGLLLVRRSSGAGPGRWEILAALLLWVYAQLVIVSWTRGIEGRGPAWRHFDIHAIGLLANGAALALLLPPLWERRRGLAAFTVGAWCALALAGLAQLSTLASGELETRRHQQIAQTQNLARFFHTQDPAHLRDKPLMQIASDRPELVTAALTDRDLRQALLPTVGSYGAPLPGTEGPLTSRLRDWRRNCGWLLGLGAFLGITGLALALPGPRSDPPDT